MPQISPIGILGGIFDPVHFGHLAVARLALEYFKLQTVYFIPAGTPAHKPAPVAASRQRLAMLKMCIGNGAEFKVWEGELRRKGPSYTVDTLQALQRRHGEAPLYFIIGSDNLKEISSWHKYREILKLAVFCVAHRPGHSMKIPRELSTIRVKRFPGPEWKLSSTMVREYCAAGFSCAFLLPPQVIGYIKKQRLYAAR